MKLDEEYFGKTTLGSKPVQLILNRNDDDLDSYLEKIDQYVKNHAGKITTTQLRNIFSVVKKIKPDELPKLKMLRVKLAYIAGRNEKKRDMVQLCALLDALIREVNKDKFQVFQDFFEAVIAYHKYHSTIKEQK